jgi:hypothetical protein
MNEPGNTEYVVHVAKSLGELYKHVIEWTEDFNRLPADDSYNPLLAELLAAGIHILSEIEQFSTDLQADIKTAISSPNQDHHIAAHLTFSLPDPTRMLEALHRLEQQYGVT